MNTVLLITSTVFTGLMAGLFYAWSISVTPGIGRLPDAGYLAAFQAMNRAILNPTFFIPFMGLVLLLPLTTFRLYQAGSGATTSYAFAATALYLIGIMAITVFGNVPLNNTLEVLSIENMTADELATFREGFELKWNRLNWLRTGSSFLALILLVLACLQQLNK